jgi:hypothetical protein
MPIGLGESCCIGMVEVTPHSLPMKPWIVWMMVCLLGPIHCPTYGAKQALDITYVGIVGLTCNGIGPSYPYETMEVCSVYTMEG